MADVAAGGRGSRQASLFSGRRNRRGLLNIRLSADSCHQYDSSLGLHLNADTHPILPDAGDKQSRMLRHEPGLLDAKLPNGAPPKNNTGASGQGLGGFTGPLTTTPKWYCLPSKLAHQGGLELNY